MMLLAPLGEISGIAARVVPDLPIANHLCGDALPAMFAIVALIVFAVLVRVMIAHVAAM